MSDFLVDKGMTLSEAHQAMQAGVKLSLEIAGVTTEAPVGNFLKMVRTGLNNALAYQGALAHLLCKKNLITLEEYEEELRLFANNEVARYEKDLSEMLTILGPGDKCTVTLHAGPEPLTGQGAGHVRITKE